MVCLVQRRIQRDDVLQALDTLVESSHRDMERAVLPEDVVGHDRAGDRRAVRHAVRAASIRTHERRIQVRRVRRHLKPCRLVGRRRDRLAGGFRAIRGAVRWADVGHGCRIGVEQHTGRGCRIVRDDRVVDEAHVHGILQRHAATRPASHVVADDVVDHRHVVPVARVGWAALYVRAVDVLQPQPAALAAFGGVAHQQVAVDHQARPNAIGQLRRAVNINQRVLAEGTVRRHALGDDATAVGRQRRVVALVEQHPVVGDVAVVAEAEVRETATVATAEVAAHPVVVELVVVRTGAERHPARGGRRGRVDLVAVRRIVRDRVVVHVHIGVVHERQLRHAIHIDGAVGRLHLPNGDATGERASVARHTGVGDLQVMVPAMHEDPAAALRAVGEGDAVDARRVAQEVARVVVAVVRAVRERRADAVRGAVRIGLQAVGARHVAHALGKHGHGRALIRAHQRRLHQQLAQIAVEVRVPANGGLERNRVHLAQHRRLRRRGRRRAAVRAGRVVRMGRGDQPTVECDTEQAVDLPPPRIHLAGRMRRGIDDDRRCAHALQPHGLPHQEHLPVGARPDQDQVARRGLVDRGLDRVARRVLAIHVGWRLAADRDRHGVDRLLAVVRGDDQFAAEGL